MTKGVNIAILLGLSTETDISVLQRSKRYQGDTRCRQSSALDMCCQEHWYTAGVHQGELAYLEGMGV